MATATLTPAKCHFPIAWSLPARGSSWVPDREYRDGLILKKNWGDLPRLYLQVFFPGLCGARGLHGFPNVWVVDPARRTISSWSREGSHVFAGAAEDIFGDMVEVDSE